MRYKEKLYTTHLNKKMKTTINLNYENYVLLKILSPIVENITQLGGMYQIEITEEQLTKIMIDMGKNQDYKYLKEHLQTIGKINFKW